MFLKFDVIQKNNILTYAIGGAPMKKVITFVILAVMLSGCATTYHKMSFTGGFSETQLGKHFSSSFQREWLHEQRTSDGLFSTTLIGIGFGERIQILYHC